MSKINVKKQNLKIKFDAESQIGNTTWPADKEISLEIEEVKELDDKDWKNETEISNKLNGKLSGKDKDEKDINGDEVKDIKVEYNRGWFTNSLKIKEVGNKKLKEAKEIGIGGDFGINWGGWGIVATILIGLSVIGYYWWSSSKQEEEEENV